MGKPVPLDDLPGHLVPDDDLPPEQAAFNRQRQAAADRKAPGRDATAASYTYVNRLTREEKSLPQKQVNDRTGNEVTPPEGFERKYPGGLPGAILGAIHGSTYGFAPDASGTIEGVGGYVKNLVTPGKTADFTRDVMGSVNKKRDLYEGTRRETDAFGVGNFAGMLVAPNPLGPVGALASPAKAVAGRVAPALSARVAASPVAQSAGKVAKAATGPGLMDASRSEAMAAQAARGGAQGGTYGLGTDPRGVTAESVQDAVTGPGATTALAGLGVSAALTGNGRLLQTPAAQRVQVSPGLSREMGPPPDLSVGQAVKSFSPFKWGANRWNEESMRLRGGDARFSAGRGSPSGAAAAVEARGSAMGNSPGEYGATVNDFKIPQSLRTDPPTALDGLRQKYPWTQSFLGTGEKPLLGPNADAPNMSRTADILGQKSGEELGRLRSLAPPMNPQPIVDELKASAESLSGINPVRGEAVATAAKGVAQRVQDKFQPEVKIEVPVYGTKTWRTELPNPQQVGRSWTDPDYVGEIHSPYRQRSVDQALTPRERTTVIGSKPATVRPTAQDLPVDEVSRLRTQFRNEGSRPGTTADDWSIAEVNSEAGDAIGRRMNAHVESNLSPADSALHVDMRRANAMSHAIEDITNPNKAAVAAPRSLNSTIEGAAGGVVGAQLAGPAGGIVGRNVVGELTRQVEVNPAKAWSSARTSEGISGRGVSPYYQAKGAFIRGAREAPGRLGSAGVAWDVNERPDDIPAAVKWAREHAWDPTAKAILKFTSGK